MDFSDWLSANGHDLLHLSAERAAELREQWRIALADTPAPATVASTVPTPGLPSVAAGEAERVATIEVALERVRPRPQGAQPGQDRTAGGDRA